VGCRARAAKSELLRVVVVDAGPTRAVRLDPQGKAPGRGAHLHPSAECLDLAERRRAFPRAFRVEGPLELSPLRVWIDQRDDDTAQERPAPPGGANDQEWSSDS